MTASTRALRVNQDAHESANMGLAVGDYRNNGLVDLYTTSFSDDYKPLFRNDGGGNFSEIATEMGIAEVTYPFLGWGNGVHRLRQRWLEGHHVRERPLLSAGGAP